MSAHTSYARRPRAFHFTSFRYLFFGRLLTVLGNGIAAGVALPASSSMVPQTVPVKCLREANAFIQLGVYGGTVIGASLGGMLTSAIGPGWGLAIDALGFAASAPLYLLIRMAPAATKEQQSNLLQDLRDGWREFISRTWVWVVVAQFTLVNAALSGVMMVLGPVVADASFGRTGWGLSVALRQRCNSAGLRGGSGTSHLSRQYDASGAPFQQRPAASRAGVDNATAAEAVPAAWPACRAAASARPAQWRASGLQTATRAAGW